MHETDVEFVRAAVALVGGEARACRELVGLGEVNRVFVAETSAGRWVVRRALDPRDAGDTDKEAWCLRAAAAHGVPVPALVGTGTHAGTPFLVEVFVDGERGDACAGPGLWRALGRVARAIGEIALDASAPDSLFTRFGRDLPGSWRRHVAYNVDQLAAGDPLLALGVYRSDHRQALREIFERLAGEVDTFGLAHGDLVPANVIVPARGEPVVLDWGGASAGPLPHTDYLRVWGDPERLHAFAEGHGRPAADLGATLRDLWLLSRLDKVRWALDRRPDRVATLAARARTAIDVRFS